MNSHKKDVNDYFKYLRLYYMELAKKRKKELEEKKKKEELIAQRRKKQQEEFDIAKKQLQDNIDNINKKKVVSKSDLNKNEIKENTKVNNLEYVINPNIKNSVKDTKENEKKKNNTNLKQEQIKKQEELKQKLEAEKKKAEVQKKQETEKKKEEEQKKLEIEKKKAEVQKKQETEKKKAEEQKKQETEKKKAEVQKKQETEKKEKETKNKTLKGIESKTNEENKNILNPKDKDTKKDKKNKEEPNKEKQENKKEEPKNNKEKQENDKKKKNPKEEEKEKLEEKIKLGKDEFIKTINKRIKDDYESLRELDLEVHRINSLLNNTKDISDIKKLMDRLNNNQKNISSIIDRINMIKDGSIISVAYSLSKTKPNELKDYIKLLEKEANNSKYLKELYPEFKGKLDYTDTINNIKKKTDKQSESLNKKHDELKKLENKKDDNYEYLSNFNTKINTFKDKLLHFQMSIMSLENKVRGIKPVEKTETKYFLNNIEIKNTHQLEQIAIKLSKEPNNKMPVEQIFNNLRSKLKAVTTNTIVPSNNLKNSLLEEKNKLNFTNKDITSTLKEIKEFKNEFELEFNDQLSTSEFYEYFSEIEAVETKLTNQKNKADLLNSTIDKSIIENDKKISEIEKMNIEKEKQQKLEEKEKKHNEQKQQTNKQKEQTNNMNNYYNMYQNYYNEMYGYNNVEQEERRRSR